MTDTELRERFRARLRRLEREAIANDTARRNNVTNEDIIAELQGIHETLDGIFADMPIDARLGPFIDSMGKIIDVLRKRWGEP